MKESIKVGFVISIVVMLIAVSIAVPMAYHNNSDASFSTQSSIPWYNSLENYAKEHGTTVEQLTENWTADDWWHWYKYEGNPIWGSTNITDTMLATDWVHLSNVGNLTWGANYDVQAKYNTTSGMLDWIGQSNNFSAWNLKLPASYIIWKDGSTYYATNGTTGLVDYSSTNASWVIQSAIDVSTDGGTIYIKPGRYILSSKIDISTHVNLVGYGADQTILQACDNFPDSAIISFSDNTFFHMIANMRIEGNSDNNPSSMAGILNPPSDTLLLWVWVYDVRGYGLQGTNTWSLNVIASSFESCSNEQIYLYNPESCVIDSCMIASAKYPTANGIEICCTRDVNKSNVDIVQTTLRELNKGIIITQLMHSSITGCKIRDITDYAIDIAGHATYNTKNIAIHHNTIWGCGNGIRVADANCVNVKINDNLFDNISGVVITDAGTDTDIKNNIGYTTENSGTAEITGDGTNTSFNISHGLAATPTIVLVTPTNSSMASTTWWVSAKSASTFTITFSTAPASGTKLSFDWYAEV